MAKHFLKLSKILQKLLYDKRMNASELAKEVDLPIPTVHRIVTGKSTRPYKASLQPIADYFSISVDQLIGEEAISDNLNNGSSSLSKKRIVEVPLLEWSDLSSALQPSKQEAKEAVVVASDLSHDCFAVCMNDSSMEPLFPKGTVLLFDPSKKPVDRSYVLVRLKEKTVLIFRQLLVDVDLQYLKPLNPDLGVYQMRLLTKEDDVIGTLFESRINHESNDISSRE